MGQFAIKPWLKVASWLITVVLVYLNAWMVAEEISGYFQSPGNIFWKILIVIGLLLIIVLLYYTIVLPFKKTTPPKNITIHDEPQTLQIAPISRYRKIAITLDFGDQDEKVINHALAQGSPDCTYLLIHITESVAGTANYTESVDNETLTDSKYLNQYVQQLTAAGYKAEARLGFGKTAQSIANIVQSSGCDLLVIGAHGHKGIKDFIYGETINNLRHLVNIPVLVVQG